MEHRVAAAFFLVFFIFSLSAQAGLRERSAFSHALTEHLDEAYDGFAEIKNPSGSSLYFFAYVMLKLHMIEKAHSVLHTLAADQNNYAGPAMELAVKDFFEAGEYDEVASLAKTAKATKFKDRNLLNYEIGQSYFMLGDFDAAEAKFLEVEGGSSRPYAQHALGLINFSRKKPREAMENLSSAVEAVKALTQKDLAVSLADRIRLTLGRVVYQSAMGMTDLSDEDRRKLFSVAVEQFEAVKEESLFFSQALRGLGWTTLEMDDSAKALASFEAASEIDPQEIHGDYWAMGRIYQRLGLFEEAAKMYAAARDAAKKLGIEIAQGEIPSAESSSSMSRWTRLAEGVEQSQKRLVDQTEKEQLISVGIDLKAQRFKSADERLEKLKARAKELDDQLFALADGLDDYIDQMSASELFPAGQRAYLDRVISLRDAVHKETAYMEDLFLSFETNVLWLTATREHKDKAAKLWSELQKTKKNLEDARFNFLLATKDRVNIRKMELSQWIERLREGVAALEEPARRTEGAIAEAKATLEKRRARLESAARFRQAIMKKLESLGNEADIARQSEEKRLAEQRAKEVALLADHYALDETEALLLLHEQGETKSKGNGQ